MRDITRSDMQGKGRAEGRRVCCVTGHFPLVVSVGARVYLSLGASPDRERSKPDLALR